MLRRSGGAGPGRSPAPGAPRATRWSRRRGRAGSPPSVPMRCDSGNSTSSSSSTSRRMSRRDGSGPSDARPACIPPPPRARAPPGRRSRATGARAMDAATSRPCPPNVTTGLRRAVPLRRAPSAAPTSAASLVMTSVEARLGHGHPGRHAAAQLEQLHEVEARLEVGRDGQRARVAHHRHRRALLPQQQELGLVVGGAAAGLDVGDAVARPGSARPGGATRRAAGRSRARRGSISSQCSGALRARHQVLDDPVLEGLVAEAGPQRAIDARRRSAPGWPRRVSTARASASAPG